MSRATRAGFTLVEMLIVVAIIGILTTMLMPTIMDAMESGRTAECSSNLHQIGIALKGMQNRNRVPRVVSNNPDADFDEIMWPAVGGSEKAFKCPTNIDDDAVKTSYGFHIRLHRWGPEDNKVALALDYGNRVVNPYVSESDADDQRRNDRFEEEPNVDDPEYGLLRPRHRGFCNILFGDLHVAKFDSEFVLFQEIDVDELSPDQVEKLEEEFGEAEVDIENLTTEQTAFIESLLFRDRWLMLRDEHLLNSDNQWTGETLPTIAPADTEETVP